MMLMLKMLVLKLFKKYINIYKYKLSIFRTDDTKQAKNLIFIVVPQVEQFPKEIKKKKKKRKRKEMLDNIRTNNNSSYKLI